MAKFSYCKNSGRASARVLFVAVLTAGAAIDSLAEARDDILVTLDPNASLVFMEIDGFGADMGLVRGTASLETDDALCVASADHPCKFTVNFMRVELSTFDLPTSEGVYTVADPYSVIQGPIEVIDQGFGLVIPAGVQSEGGGTCSGPHIDTGFRASTQGLPVPMSVNLDVRNQTFSIEGEFLTSIEGHTGVGTIIASGNRPFLNVPPVANAGPDVQVICPQNVTLVAGASTDANDTLELFRWSSGGVTLGSIPAVNGSSISVPFAVGSFDVLLEAFDSFGGRGTDHVIIQVIDPKPNFTFVPGPLTTTSCGALNLGQAQATDPCGKPVTITNNAPASFTAGVTLVTWTATSSTGQKSTALQRVEVELGNDPACCPAGYNRIVGTSNNDNLVGTSGNDCILGLGAQDTINGGGGNDLISGGDGDDTVGSSRVDLQACKLEYSIVSPK